MYKVAIIGCGWVGLEHASGYREVEDCRIVGAVDPVIDMAGKLTEKYGGNAYAGLNELLSREKPDIVSVCTPPASHGIVIENLLSSGVTSIVCEKPLARNTAEARNILEAASSRKALLMTAFCHRFVEPVRKIREMIQSGILGDLNFFRNQFSSRFEGIQQRWFSKPKISGGGCMMDTSVHSIDLFRHLCGEVKNLSARSITRMPELVVEDTSMILVQSENGCIGTIEASWNMAKGQAVLEIGGSKGRVLYEYWGELRQIAEGEDKWKTIPISRNINRRFEDELRHFVNAVKGEEKLGPTGEDGLRAVELIEAAYRSIREQKWISV